MGNRLSKIYTRTGDDGTTGLGDGSRVAKDSLRVEAYGTVDEANSCIGLLLASELPADVRALLTRVQHQLFDLGGELCIPGHAAIEDADIDALESQLDRYNDPLPALKDFILPGGGEAAARCHVARTVVPAPSAKRCAQPRGSRAPAGHPLPEPAADLCSCWRGCLRARAAMARCCGTMSAAMGEGAPVMRVYTHPACLLHDTGPEHAEQPARLRVVVEALQAAHPALDWHEAPRATRGQLLRAHAPALLDAVLGTRPQQRIQLDPDTVLSPHSAEAGLRAAGAGVAAVDAVLGGHAGRAFCAVRPPGHHATQTTAMGFCLFNSIAVAAVHALEQHGLERVAIVDFDVHHGNGTQAIFEHDRRVLFASSHQLPLYPGTGAREEIGEGNVFNAPLPPDSGSAQFREAWTGSLLPEVDAFRPQLLLVSAGFDGHRRDPLAQLQLEAEDFRWITRELVALADRHCGGRIVSMLEGGYDLEALAECSVAHLDALLA